jgi:bis(5'-nucleosyl)-tetraphosphatase (symmetrical)
MSTYAIGDIQGCARTFERLLERLKFNPRRDRLWLVGDLVNRGPDSLGVLRRVRKLGNAVTTVLGNHDLHLLARACGVRKAERDDTLDDVLAARDRDALMDWLAARPLLHVARRYLLVHAGLLPTWTVDQARRRAAEVEAALKHDRRETLASLGEKAPARWSARLRGEARLGCIVRVLTRLRCVDERGRIYASHKGPPETAPAGCGAWFDAAGRRSVKVTIICGHWAALGLRLRPNLLALDSACVWGGELTAVRLEDRAVLQVPLADRV